MTEVFRQVGEKLCDTDNSGTQSLRTMMGLMWDSCLSAGRCSGGYLSHQQGAGWVADWNWGNGRCGCIYLIVAEIVIETCCRGLDC